MNIERIDNHSIDTDLLTGGYVLDAGCRGFRFTNEILNRGCRVIALDPATDVEYDVPSNRLFDTGCAYFRTALVATDRLGKVANLVTTDDPEAMYLGKGEGYEVPATSIERLSGDLSIHKWDAIKLNIEGSEYDILDQLMAPFTKQIVVSFHEHTPRFRGRSECDRIISKLKKWYTPVINPWDERYCAGFNYWDTLLVENSLVH